MTQNKDSREDRRVTRTHKLILDALIDLTVQKGFSAVTVSDIANHAGINRATFYRHYQDKHDVLAKYLQAVYELLNVPAKRGSRKKAPGNIEELNPGLVAIYDHVRAHAKFYRVMLGRNGNPQFADQMRQYIQMRIKRSLPPGVLTDESFLDIYLNHRSSATMGSVLWWLEHDMPYTPEEMVTMTHQFEAAILNVLRDQTPPVAHPMHEESMSRPGNQVDQRPR